MRAREIPPEYLPPSRADCLKVTVLSILYTISGVLTDTFFAVLRILRAISGGRPATDFRVRYRINWVTLVEL